MKDHIFLNCGERYEDIIVFRSYTHNLSTEHCTRIAKIMCSNPAGAEFFFFVFFHDLMPQLLKLCV